MKRVQSSDNQRKEIWEIGLKAIERNRQNFFNGTSIKLFVNIENGNPPKLQFSNENLLPASIKKEISVLFDVLYKQKPR
jgi:hypothetical protein